MINRKVEQSLQRDALAAAIVELARTINEGAGVYDPVDTPEFDGAFTQLAQLLENVTIAEGIAQALRIIWEQWLLEDVFHDITGIVALKACIAELKRENSQLRDEVSHHD